MALISIFYYFFPHIFFKNPVLIITYIFCFFTFIFFYLYITFYEIYTSSEFYQQLIMRFVTKKYEFYHSMDRSFIYDIEEGYENKHFTTFTLGIIYKLRYFIVLLFLLYFYHKAWYFLCILLIFIFFYNPISTFLGYFFLDFLFVVYDFIVICFERFEYKSLLCIFFFRDFFTKEFNSFSLVKKKFFLFFTLYFYFLLVIFLLGNNYIFFWVLSCF